MSPIIQTLTWTPRAKERPRFTVTKSGKVVTYTAKATRDAEAALRAQWTAPPVLGPIGVRVEMSDDAVKIEIETAEPHTSKKLRQDCDNMLKLILDALNGVAWEDDAQIVSLTGIKL